MVRRLTPCDGVAGNAERLREERVMVGLNVTLRLRPKKIVDRRGSTFQKRGHEERGNKS